MPTHAKTNARAAKVRTLPRKIQAELGRQLVLWVHEQLVIHCDYTIPHPTEAKFDAMRKAICNEWDFPRSRRNCNSIFYCITPGAIELALQSPESSTMGTK